MHCTIEHISQVLFLTVKWSSTKARKLDPLKISYYTVFCNHTLDIWQIHGWLSTIQDQIAKLEESKRVLEGELETLKQATGKEEREKADILLAEKKARAQVHTHAHTWCMQGWAPGFESNYRGYHFIAGDFSNHLININFGEMALS